MELLNKAGGHVCRMAVAEVDRGQYSIFREVKQDTGAGYLTVLS